MGTVVNIADFMKPLAVHQVTMHLHGGAAGKECGNGCCIHYVLCGEWVTNAKEVQTPDRWTRDGAAFAAHPNPCSKLPVVGER